MAGVSDAVTRTAWPGYGADVSATRLISGAATSISTGSDSATVVSVGPVFWSTATHTLVFPSVVNLPVDAFFGPSAGAKATSVLGSHR